MHMYRHLSMTNAGAWEFEWSVRHHHILSHPSHWKCRHNNIQHVRTTHLTQKIRRGEPLLGFPAKIQRFPL